MLGEHPPKAKNHLYQLSFQLSANEQWQPLNLLRLGYPHVYNYTNHVSVINKGRE